MNHLSPSEQLNHAACSLLAAARPDFDQFDIMQTKVGQSRLLDFAVGRTGTKQAGRLLAEVCLGGLAEVRLVESNDDSLPLDFVEVETNSPLLACIGGQYAGWPLQSENYFAMCSGPIRMARGKEEILQEYNLVGNSNELVGVLESNQLPDVLTIEKAANSCGASPDQITFCVARTASLPGLVQVVARSIETTLHKLHQLKFDLKTIVSGKGIAPVPPVPSDDLTALGWSNDSILYGAIVELTLDTTDEAIESTLDQIPSCSSNEFGTPFMDIFKRFDHDFYKIDPMLFSPARVVITNRSTGRVFEIGEVRNDILASSFGIE